MTVEDAIRTMRAVRKFTDQPLSDEDVTAILNAGRRSQSSKNTQPWQFVAVRDRATLQQLATTGTFAGHLAGAAVGVVLTSSVDYSYDLGQATAFMMLTAWDLGIGSCIATIYEPDQARAILGIPADQHVHWALSFGYPAADVAAAPPRKGGRRPLDEVVRWEHW
jgi:nitroreductase